MKTGEDEGWKEETVGYEPYARGITFFSTGGKDRKVSLEVSMHQPTVFFRTCATEHDIRTVLDAVRKSKGW